MERGRVPDFERRVLRVEGGNVAFGKAGLGMRPHGGGDAWPLLGENVERARVHITVDQDNLALGPLHECNQELERIVDLSLEEDLLIRRLVGLHVVEDALEALVGGFLVFQLPELNRADLLEHAGIVRDEVSHLDESVHDFDAYLYCRLAPEDSGEHGNALLGKHPGEVASAASTLGRL